MPNITSELREILQRSKVYLHTGSDEPFGVSIVEAMSSGCITVVPDSGGPKEFVPKEYRYKTIEEAAFLVSSSIFEWSPEKSKDFVRISKEFSEEKFSKEFLRIMSL